MNKVGACVGKILLISTGTTTLNASGSELNGYELSAGMKTCHPGREAFELAGHLYPVGDRGGETRRSAKG